MQFRPLQFDLDGKMGSHATEVKTLLLFNFAQTLSTRTVAPTFLIGEVVAGQK